MDAGAEFMNEFLACYEMQRCLWDRTSPEYIFRERRDEAYEELLNVMKKYKSKCVLEDVKRKINTIRSSYRRELNKIKRSESFGADDNNIYQPKIWWFPSCEFLQLAIEGTALTDEDPLHEQTLDVASIQPATKFKREKKQKDVKDMAMSYVKKRTSSYEHLELPGAAKVRKMESKQSKLALHEQKLEVANIEPATKFKREKKQNDVKDVEMSYVEKKTSSYDHLGLAWAGKLRNMESKQRKLAERLVSEILFQGDIGMLTLSTTIKNKRLQRSPTPDEFW